MDGYVVRERVSTNLPHWKKLDLDQRECLVIEIMKHFHVADPDWKKDGGPLCTEKRLGMVGGIGSMSCIRSTCWKARSPSPDTT